MVGATNKTMQICQDMPGPCEMFGATSAGHGVSTTGSPNWVFFLRQQFVTPDQPTYYNGSASFLDGVYLRTNLPPRPPAPPPAPPQPLAPPSRPPRPPVPPPLSEFVSEFVLPTWMMPQEPEARGLLSTFAWNTHVT